MNQKKMCLVFFLLSANFLVFADDTSKLVDDLKMGSAQEMQSSEQLLVQINEVRGGETTDHEPALPVKLRKPGFMTKTYSVITGRLHEAQKSVGQWAEDHPRIVGAAAATTLLVGAFAVYALTRGGVDMQVSTLLSQLPAESQKVVKEEVINLLRNAAKASNEAAIQVATRKTAV